MSTIFKTCTSKNGERVTEGAYAFAWDGRGSWERVRADEKISGMKKKTKRYPILSDTRALGNDSKRA